MELQGKIVSINPGCVMPAPSKQPQWAYTLQVNSHTEWCTDYYPSCNAAKQAMREECYRLRVKHCVGAV